MVFSHYTVVVSELTVVCLFRRSPLYHVYDILSCVDADRGKAIFVAATKEHTGKTSVSMALIAGLVRRYRRLNCVIMI